MIDFHVAQLFSVDMIDVGARIRQRIAEMGITQADVARALGISQQRLGNYVNGKRPPDIETLVKVAKALNVSTDWLLGINESAPTDIKAVVLRLLELDGIPETRAQVIAEVAARALQLLSALPAEGDARTRALLAAQAAWQSKPPSKPN